MHAAVSAAIGTAPQRRTHRHAHFRGLPPALGTEEILVKDDKIQREKEGFETFWACFLFLFLNRGRVGRLYADKHVHVSCT